MKDNRMKNVMHGALILSLAAPDCENLKCVLPDSI